MGRSRSADRDPAARPAPAAPRIPAATVPSDPAALAPDDEWQELRVDGADLSGSIADHVEIATSELHGVQLTGAELEDLRLVDVVAQDCELSGAILHGASIVRVEFHNCRMTGLVISEAKLSNVRFVDCKLDDANLRFLDRRAGRLRPLLTRRRGFLRRDPDDGGVRIV